jgi:site-specific DNA-cytosine methylase
VDSTNQSPTVLSLCSGIRGLERGLEQAIGPVRTICYVENEAFVIENLAAEMEAGEVAPAPIWPDVKTFKSKIFRDRVDWLLGGYPCTPFSLAGKRKGREQRLFILAVSVGQANSHSNGRRKGLGRLQKTSKAIEGKEQRQEWDEENRQWHLDNIDASSSGVANADSERQQQSQGHKQESWGRISNKSKEGNLDGQAVTSEQGLSGQRNKPSRSGKKQSEPTSHCTTHSLGVGQADSNISRSGKDFESSELRTDRVEQSRSDSREANKIKGKEVAQWPARPSHPQQAWEQKRVISREVESSLGITIDDGKYSFREDFLRAIGNMVVPDCAEKAVRDLLRKHRLTQ